MTRKYDESVEIINKLALLCFESIGKAHECHRYGVFIGHTFQLQAMCYLLMCKVPKHYVGKDRQHTRILELARCAVHTGKLHDTRKMQRARRVCALESSSITPVFYLNDLQILTVHARVLNIMMLTREIREESYGDTRACVVTRVR